VLDALVHRQDGHVAGSGQAAVVEQRLEVSQDLRGPIRLGVHIGNRVGSRGGQLVGGDRLRLVFEQVLGVVA